jgi:hypothetical protein
MGSTRALSEELREFKPFDDVFDDGVETNL